MLLILEVVKDGHGVCRGVYVECVDVFDDLVKVKKVVDRGV